MNDTIAIKIEKLKRRPGYIPNRSRIIKKGFLFGTRITYENDTKVDFKFKKYNLMIKLLREID